MERDIIVDSFVDFVSEVEARLRQSLTATLGTDLGPDAAAEAMAYGWQNWDKIKDMKNPAGYLYTVGRSVGRRAQRRQRKVTLMAVPAAREPWVEPHLPDALARLPEKQRVVVMLLHSFDWSMAEVAELLDISKSSVQTHSERALKSLRKRLGVRS